MSQKTLPRMIYGTAWKEDLTEACVLDALRAGFRAIDTANQRKHYFEEGVGTALAKACSQGGLKREDLFLQTKFTYARGQDHRKPYEDGAAPAIQVQQSLDSSLRHLGTDVLDSYVLHGPSTGEGLTDVDWETWGAMENAHRAGKARNLGISNVSLAQLEELHLNAGIKPVFVQNRCFAETRWDAKVREFCGRSGISYQGFSLLTANSKFLGGEVRRPAGRNVPHLLFADRTEALSVHPRLGEILQQTGKTMQQLVFRFAQQVGMIPVVGTRSFENMKLDLAIGDFTLTEEQLGVLEHIASLPPVGV